MHSPDRRSRPTGAKATAAVGGERRVQRATRPWATEQRRESRRNSAPARRPAPAHMGRWRRSAATAKRQGARHREPSQPGHHAPIVHSQLIWRGWAAPQARECTCPQRRRRRGARSAARRRERLRKTAVLRIVACRERSDRNYFRKTVSFAKRFLQPPRRTRAPRAAHIQEPAGGSLTYSIPIDGTPKLTIVSSGFTGAGPWFSGTGTPFSVASEGC